MSREEFERAIVKVPEPGNPGEVVFDFRTISNGPCQEFRHVTVFEWTEDGVAMEECWQAYLNEVEADWSE
jgi:hypothetical protein